MNRSVVTIGNFDGVHRGHREVLAAAQATEPGRPLVVLTFWPHPVAVLRPDKAPKLLSSLEERVALLTEAGAARVEVIEFTPELSQLSPAAFVDRFVLPQQPARVVVGENFRFGHRAAGTIETLRELGEGRFAVSALPLLHLGDARACSSGVRTALEEGDIATANAMLGRPFRYRGVVAHGDKRGRELGFPTANLPVPPSYACPADGVYAGWVTRLDGRDGLGAPLPEGTAPQRWPAAISVGSNPTFDGVERRVESNVLDRDDLELYDAPIAVDFEAHLRGQIRFEGIGSLIDQMDADVERTRVALGLEPDA